MFDFDAFFEKLKAGAEGIARKEALEFALAAQKDSRAFLETFRGDLQRYTELAATGRITREEFEFLVMAKRDLAAMEALKQAGLAKIRIEKIKNGILELVISSVFELI